MQKGLYRLTPTTGLTPKEDEMTHTININLDKKCSKCGKPGPVGENKAGLCLACIAKIASKRK
jgi:hypothetical protein